MKKLTIVFAVLYSFNNLIHSAHAGEIQRGDLVMENAGDITVQKVLNISDHLYELEDHVWYPEDYIHALETELNGIRVGDSVMEDAGDPKIEKVKTIAADLFQLEDGTWYPEDYVHPLAP